MRICRMVSFFFFSILFLGCQTDENAAFKVSDNAPAISIEIVDEREINDITKKYITFRLVANRAPKTDLLILLRVSVDPCKTFLGKNSAGWATIPKGEKNSKVFSQDMYFHSYRYAYVDPIPTVSVVGEGEIVDPRLSSFWNEKTLEGQYIPTGFQFPYYKVATPTVLLYRPGKAKIISVDPPNGSEIVATDSEELFPGLKSEITITFDNPPECPEKRENDDLFTFSLFPDWRSRDIKAGTVFKIRVPDDSVETYRLTISWGHEDVGTASQHEFEYTLKR